MYFFFFESQQIQNKSGSCTRGYWPSVIFCTATTSGQYSSVRPLYSVSNRLPFTHKLWLVLVDQGSILVNRTACKWRGYIFGILTNPVSKYIMSIVAAANGHRKSRYKWKPRPVWLPWRLKGRLLLFLLIFDLFFQSEHYLTTYPDQNSRCNHALPAGVFADADAEHTLVSGWQNENWACSDLIHG